ncbi:hypothetical protein IGI50_003841 [Enterococcus sp. DIV0170]|jgi:hypothetical protein
MKNIKFNHSQLFQNISRILIVTAIALLDRPCFLFGYEPENPKLKNLKKKNG